MCTCSPPCRRRQSRSAFTLVEIISVVAITGLLTAILLPTLASAREHANRTKCLSNLRQLGLAFTMYLGENNGRFPRPAQHRVPQPEDWIHYQSDRDVEDSAIARYASKPFNPSLYRCPSDDVSSHITFRDPFGPDLRYEFSYAVNERICRIWPQPTLRIGQIRNASEKILLIDESAATIDDGCWAWQPSMGSGKNVLSNRHDRKSEKPRRADYGRGNAIFVDGHAEFIPREQSFEPRHYDPLWR